MVTIHDDSNKNENRKDDPITKRTFLSSLLSWYPDGIPCEVESISNIFQNAMNNNKPSLFVNLKILSMGRCRMRNIGEDGKAIKINNELGEAVDEIVEMDASEKNVSLSFNLKYSENDDTGDLFSIHELSSFFPLLNYGLIQRDMIPSSNKKGFDLSYEEILEALEELGFIAKAERIEPKGNSFKPYNKLIVGEKSEV